MAIREKKKGARTHGHGKRTSVKDLINEVLRERESKNQKGKLPFCENVRQPQMPHQISPRPPPPPPPLPQTMPPTHYVQPQLIPARHLMSQHQSFIMPQTHFTQPFYQSYNPYTQQQQQHNQGFWVYR